MSLSLPESYQWVDCKFEQHAEEILAIWNHEILHSTALYESEPRQLAMVEAWFQSKQQLNFPVMGVVAPNGELAGFASFGHFRPQPLSHSTVEHSIYIQAQHQGLGLGKRLLTQLIQAARQQNFHALIGVIDAKNTASIVLHQKLGFQHVGSMPQIARKFNRWLDAEFYQLLL
ncbi:GNAT family N-acetyltransferase [Acinetobacter sp. MD2(2019)]|uniref:GNAT family N-acetyltransferase n=1 Tax=Acinetobacter sp. MD2(2019) TaxID=2605273 RepID=UPI002D1F1678|nr:GNAT family N-acetyltransferase [Acinetobacter sp. MD2(2019)]MEB3753177.1 N-acetyltransferase [Acinetobacter sp. MD2(2019)]